MERRTKRIHNLIGNKIPLMKELLREIPQISKILERFKGRYPADLVKKVAREITDRYREEILSGKRKEVSGIYRDIEEELERRTSSNLKRVINATGVVINTNLGRSPLAKETMDFIEEIATGYSNLEYDLEEGKRGSRNAHLEAILCDLTGAEGALVVNNNAGAVYLVLNTLAKGREVIVSRGELVEIGGSFRIPDIMESSGATLREVGTTNKTRLSDYENAINENTALLMKVHKSNFYMGGFTEEVSPEDLVRLGRDRSIPTYYDLGSGLMVDLKRLGIHSREHTFGEVLSLGFDLVSGSGDKLLGATQAGVILGRRELIDRIRKNPMTRALRVDKLTLAGLLHTLRLYAEGRYRDIPVIAMLTENEESLRRRARRIKRRLKNPKGIRVKVVKDVSRPGGGSLPEVSLPTYCLALECDGMDAQEIASRLRSANQPVIGRIKEGSFLLDVRTILEEDIGDLVNSLLSLVRS